MSALLYSPDRQQRPTPSPEQVAQARADVARLLDALGPVAADVTTLAETARGLPGRAGHHAACAVGLAQSLVNQLEQVGRVLDGEVAQ